MTTERHMIKILQASEEGKRIEQTELGSPLIWKPFAGKWNWEKYSFRIAPEPKKESQWERVEIAKDDGQYCLIHPVTDVYVIDALPRVPGFGGIDYQSPFDPKVIVRSTVPVMFNSYGISCCNNLDESCRPGIPVAAWFWKEE